MSTKFQRAQPRIVYQLRIELQHIEPLIWRRILVPDTVKLAKLDRIVQAAMGWTNSHQHDWHIERQRYGIPDNEWAGSGDMRDERKFTIGAVLGELVNEFMYSYDFGDGWDHRIMVEERLPIQEGRNDWPMCLAGENACPPEDVGGPPGYIDFLQAMRDPRHEQHADYWVWWGGPFDPKSFGINAANMRSASCADLASVKVGSPDVYLAPRLRARAANELPFISMRTVNPPARPWLGGPGQLLD